jgi:predicted DNA-binding transcriptional regulator AlpA
MSPQLSEMPDVPEVSAFTGIPEPTWRWYRSVGKGPKSFRLGRRIRYHKADVLAWLDEQESKSARGGVR